MTDDQSKLDEATALRQQKAKLANQRKRALDRQVALSLSGKSPEAQSGTALVKDNTTSDVSAPKIAQPLTFKPKPWPTAVLPLHILTESRRLRRRSFYKRLALFCGLPTVLTFLYMVFVASPRYIAEFEITYQAYQPQQTLSSGLEQTFLGASQGSTVDLSSIVYEYLRSGALMTRLDEKLNLRQYYGDSKVDYFSRLNSHANSAAFLRAYHWYVSVSEGQGGYLTVDVEAFDPQFALAMSKEIVSAVDEMIDNMTMRARQDEVRYSEEQVTQAEGRMLKARLALTAFQNAHSDLNPQGSASQLSGIIGQLEGELSSQRASLAALRTMGPASPAVVATNSKIAALEQQLKQEQQRLAGPSGDKNYAEVLNQYSALLLEQDFAKDGYTQAQQGLAVARADAAHKQNYLIDFVPPHIPDKSGMELTLQYTMTVLMLSLVLFGIGSLIAGATRDQSGL